MKQKKKTRPEVILVSPAAPPIGGVTRWTLLVQQELQNRGINFETINTSPGRRQIDGRSKIEQVFGGLLNAFRSVILLLRQIMAGKPKAVHISTSGGMALLRDLLVALVCRIAKVQVLLHLHNGRLPQVLRKRSIERIAMDLIMSQIDTLILLDNPSATAAAKRWKDKAVRVIANPVRQTERLKAIPDPKGRSIVYLGWLKKEKGIEDLLAAWNSLADLFPEWSIKLVGGASDEYRSWLYSTYNLPAKRAELLGELSHDQAMDVLISGDLLVLPSYSEGFPNVILEAMALAKPVVATRVGAIPAMLDEGGGLLVDPGSVVELEAALVTLLRNEELRFSQGRRGYRKVSREYGISVVVDKYLEIWGVRTWDR